jgi:hypothetical protein
MIQLLDVFVEMALHICASGALSAASRRCLRFARFLRLSPRYFVSIFSMIEHIDHAAAPQTTRGSADNAAQPQTTREAQHHPNLPVT